MTTRPFLEPPLAPPFSVTADSPNAELCLNCGAVLGGEYCSDCGQRRVDLSAGARHVAREVLAEITDVDRRLLNTGRALLSPGELTMEYFRGRRVRYLTPVKLFLLAGTLLTTTWIMTRGVDAHYYGMRADTTAGAYIDGVVRGSIAASVGIAIVNWIISLGRRRIVDEGVFALHLVAAMSCFFTGVVWLGTAWKLVWGTVASTPSSVPNIMYLVFLPAGIVAIAYSFVAAQRVYHSRWWEAAFRTAVNVAVGFGALTLALIRAH